MDLDVLFYVLAGVLVLVGIAGTVLPGLPGLPLVFAGMLLAAWAGDFQQVGWFPLVVLGLMTALSLGIDFLATAMGVAVPVGAPAEPPPPLFPAVPAEAAALDTWLSAAGVARDERLALVKSAVPLTTDPALLAAHSLAIQTLVAQVAALRPWLEQYDQQIAQLFAAHPDAGIFDCLPGAGPVLAPRLLTAMGTDRSHFADATAVSCFTGIAPVTEKSGKTQFWVHLRWSCPKFLRQTWHEFANSSLKTSAWARLLYDDLRTRMTHHEAVRKVAYKWQRIVWRMWQDRQSYDENRYLLQLQKRGLKLYTAAAIPASQPSE